MRENKRYIGFEILASQQIPFKSFESSFNDMLHNFIGVLGCANAGAYVIKEKYENNKGIIRVNTNYVDHVKATFTFIKKIENVDVTVKSIRTSGMINKALR
ncbi:hypothetical protein JXM83_03600 [Candidatus Woesearchaeota archaeon]|nr:hypothetical protein [Candidatus Woesearchaeota archaeon]